MKKHPQTQGMIPFEEQTQIAYQCSVNTFHLSLIVFELVVIIRLGHYRGAPVEKTIPFKSQHPASWTLAGSRLLAFARLQPFSSHEQKFYLGAAKAPWAEKIVQL
jgi:hypothetical protein